MLKSRWHDLAELVGIGAIVASLIFVGLQLKQAQDIAIAEQYQTRAMFAVELGRARANDEILRSIRADEFRQLYESGEFGESYAQAFEVYGPEFFAASMSYLGEMLIIYDNYYFQYQKGLMEEEAWAAFRFQLKATLRPDLSRRLFRIMPPVRRSSFQALCDKLIAEIEAEEGLAE